MKVVEEKGSEPVGLEEARERVRSHIEPMESEEIGLLGALGRVLCREVRARVDSPSADVSLKDGFALRACDTALATTENPAWLPVVGSRFAGEELDRGGVPPGACVKITSGAVLPKGADAVVGVEHCRETSQGIRVPGPVTPGLNVLARGTDIVVGATLGKPGDRLGPGTVGWLAAAGLNQVPVHRVPTVSVVATGDEVVAPGTPLEKGQVYASNLFTLSAWLSAFGILVESAILPDRREDLRRGLPRAIESRDVLLTSGGAWGSERDLVIGVLDELGWQKIFHRVRMGPGKAVGFGMLGDRPVFCLPGGPPSNEMAFLQLALPGVLRLAGWRRSPFPTLTVRLSETIQGREIDWTQFKRGTLFYDREGTFGVRPHMPKSRFESMALADCLIEVPEGVEKLEAGQWVSVQVITQPPAFFSQRWGGSR